MKDKMKQRLFCGMVGTVAAMRVERQNKCIYQKTFFDNFDKENFLFLLKIPFEKFKMPKNKFKVPKNKFKMPKNKFKMP